MKSPFCYLFSAFLLILCYSCRQQYNRKIVEGYMSSETLIDSNDTTAYKIIPLEKRDEVVLDRCAKIMMNDSLICLLDNGPDVVCTYGTDGRFINKIFKLGRARYEYASVADMYQGNLSN